MLVPGSARKGHTMSFRSLTLGTAGLVVSVGLLVAAATATAKPSAVLVKAVSNPALGVKILVDTKGRALYRFTEDRRFRPTCSGGCARTWPPLIAPKSALPKVRGGAGVAAKKLGVVLRPDGRLQVTYAGFPLYRFAADAPRSIRGQGLGNVWFLVSPSGKLVKSRATPETGGDPEPSDPGGGPPVGY